MIEEFAVTKMIAVKTITNDSFIFHYVSYIKEVYEVNQPLTRDSLIGGYQYCIETNYNKELISIEDHGNGLEYAKKLLENEVLKRQKV